MCSVNAVKEKQFRQKSEHIDAGPVRSILLCLLADFGPGADSAALLCFMKSFNLLCKVKYMILSLKYTLQHSARTKGRKDGACLYLKSVVFPLYRRL